MTCATEKRVGKRRQTAAKTPEAKPATDNSQFECTPDEGLTLEEALRTEGINERTIAKGYVSLHGKLINSTDKGDLKLFVDILDKNSRILEPAHVADRSSAGQNVTVILKHNMARPARELKKQSP